MAPSLSFFNWASSTAIRFKNEVASDYDPHGETWPNGDGGLDAQRAADHLLSGLVDALRQPLLDCLRERAVAVAARAGFRADAQDGREDRCLEQHAPVVIDLVFQAGIALRIGARLALEHDRPAIRHDQPVPDQQGARLAESDLRVVLANKAGA